jgi:hypothetical protein
MRVPVRVLVCLAIISSVANAQQLNIPSAGITTSDMQALAVLAKAGAALGASTTLHDISLTGSVRQVAGSDDESGTATVKALSAGPVSIALSLASGNRSELRNPLAVPPAGNWAGPDGIVHSVAYHNLLAEPLWISSTALVVQALASQTLVVSSLGPTTIGGTSVQHLMFIQPSTDSSSTGRMLQNLTRFDLYFDSLSFLPVAVTFNIHADNDALTDIPVEIHYSDYRPVNGIQIPFHIQKLITNTLSLEFQFSSATVNSGLTAADFAVSQ